MAKGVGQTDRPTDKERMNGKELETDAVYGIR